MSRLLSKLKAAKEFTRKENNYFQQNINLKNSIMKGKIFAESINVSQDQAKILFNYYQQVAEKIVEEEERYEKEIAKLEEDKMALKADLSKAKLWKWVLFILIIPFIYFLIKEKGLVKEITALDVRIQEFNKLHSEIFRDYKISKLGIAYVPVANQIKYENKSFIIDYSGKVEESEVKLQLSKQNDLLIEKIADLERLSTQAPMVETSNEIEEIDTEQYSRSMQYVNQHDYFGSLERSLRTISFCMDDLDITSVSLPLVGNNSSYLDFIKEYATSEIPQGAPVFSVFNTNKYDTDVSKFQELNKLKDSLSRHSQQFEDVLKSLMLTMANSVQAISALKIASTDKIVFESNKVLYKILKSPYNHYSPTLEASEIERIRIENFNYGDSAQDYIPFQLKESSRAKYNLLADSWVAEDGSSTSFPFGIHQIHEEIVAPIVQNLMKETRIERMKIYNHIKDQKISYLNKWHQDTEDFYGRNRSESADLINLMRASLRDYVTAYNTMVSLKKTEESMAASGGSLDATVVATQNNSAEVFAAFELQSKEFQNVQLEFENYMERLKEDIDTKAEKFEHIDYYDALLRDGNSKDTAVAAGELHDMDERRKPLISINPLFAKNSEMPPVPTVEELTYQHISLNLPSIAKNALRELDEDLIKEPISDDEIEVESTLENVIETENPTEELTITDEKSEDSITSVENTEVETNSLSGIEVEEKEDNDENEESDLYTETELNALTDDELLQILEDWEIQIDNFERALAIAAILDAQNEEEEDENDEEDNDDDENEKNN
jgi:hypothetical protein